MNGFPAVEIAGAARNDQQLRFLRPLIGIERALLEESPAPWSIFSADWAW